MAGRPPGYFLYSVKNLENALSRRFLAACSALGMTGAQYTALAVLRQYPGITSSELSRRSFVRAQTMAATLAPMLKEGLAKRAKDPAHGRRMLLTLTPEGERRMDKLVPHVDDLDELMVNELSEDERALFADLLRRCRFAMQQNDGEAKAYDGRGR